MGGYEITRMIGETSATYKFTAKTVLKPDQKVTVNLPIICTALVWRQFPSVKHLNIEPCCTPFLAASGS